MEEVFKKKHYVKLERESFHLPRERWVQIVTPIKRNQILDFRPRLYHVWLNLAENFPQQWQNI